MCCEYVASSDVISPTELTNAKKRKTTPEKISTFFAQNRAEVPATVDVDNDEDSQEEAAQGEAAEEIVQDTAEGDEEMIDEYLENDDISVSIGEYVSAVYDEQPYIGRVQDVDGDEVHVDFMEPHVKENTQQNFQWPSRGDDVWVRKRDVLCVICLPEETKRGYKFTSDIHAKIYAICFD